MNNFVKLDCILCYHLFIQDSQERGVSMGFFSKRKEKKQALKWESEKQMIIEESYQAELLPKWLADWLMEIIEREEAVRPTSEMSMWIEKDWLSGEGDLPDDFKDEKRLKALYKEKDAWVEEKLKWHLDLRMLKGSDFDSEVYKRGKEIDVMSKEAQKAYLAIFYEIQNVISQTHTY